MRCVLPASVLICLRRHVIRLQLSLFFVSALIFIVLQENLYAAPKVYNIAVDEWAPFRMIDQNRYRGIDFDLWQEISQRTGLKFKYIRTPWARSLFEMEEGTVDAMSGLAYRPDRAEFISYTSTSYYSARPAFYVLKGQSKNISSYSDLNKYLIGFTLQSAYFLPFDTDTLIKKHGVPTEAQLISMLLYHRFDAFIGTDCQVDYDMSQLGYQNKIEKAVYKPDKDVQLFIGVSKKSALIKEFYKIDKCISQIVKEKKIQEFAAKYYK